MLQAALDEPVQPQAVHLHPNSGLLCGAIRFLQVPVEHLCSHHFAILEGCGLLWFEDVVEVRDSLPSNYLHTPRRRKGAEQNTSDETNNRLAS